MIFIGDAQNKSLSVGVAKRLSLPLFYPDIKVFPDGERRVRLVENVVGLDVVFLKTSSITPNVDSLILETSFLIDACKRSGARKVTGIIPYMPYARADHVFEDGEAVPFEVVIHIFEKAGLTKVIFVDPHTVRIKEMFKIPVVSLSALTLFAERIKELGFDPKDSVLVSPDKGGLRRVKQLSELLDNAPFITLEKDRDHLTGKINMHHIEEKVPANCYLIDDMISSGGTIIKAVAELEKQNAKNIYVMATHGVFSSNASEVLEDSSVKKVIVTDSIPVSSEKMFKKLEVLTLSSLFPKKL